MNQDARKRAAEAIFDKLKGKNAEGRVVLALVASAVADLPKHIQKPIGALLFREATVRHAESIGKEELINLIVSEMEATKQLGAALAAGGGSVNVPALLAPSPSLAARGRRAGAEAQQHEQQQRATSPAAGPGAASTATSAGRKGRFSPDKMMNKHAAAQKRIDDLRAAKEAAEMAQCTFTPRKFSKAYLAESGRTEEDSARRGPPLHAPKYISDKARPRSAPPAAGLSFASTSTSVAASSHYPHQDQDVHHDHQSTSTVHEEKRKDVYVARSSTSIAASHSEVEQVRAILESLTSTTKTSVPASGRYASASATSRKKGASSSGGGSSVDPTVAALQAEAERREAGILDEDSYALHDEDSFDIDDE
jgi:hypothetical protein